jgi:PilZ domain
MSGLPGKTDNPGSTYRVKREVPRFSLNASVEVTEPNTGARIQGRTTEISRKGCFVETSNVLAVGTPIKIVISREQGTFTTDGTILYTQEGTGIGVVFKPSALEQLGILDQWLGASSSLCFFTPGS